jgi:hypothetical protein
MLGSADFLRRLAILAIAASCLRSLCFSTSVLSQAPKMCPAESGAPHRGQWKSVACPSRWAIFWL